MRVRVTDQARLVIEIARRLGGSPPDAVAVITALASELEGRAGHLLRANSSAITALVEAAGSGAQPGSPLDVVLADAAVAAAPRPVATGDLLRACLDDLRVRALLGSVDLDPRALDPGPEPPWGAAWAAAETLGAAAGPTDGLDATATQVVGRVRACAGGAVDLLCALATTGEPPALAPVDPAALLTVRLDESDPPPDSGGQAYDHGLDAVVESARRRALPRPAACVHLLAAVLEDGGWGPRTRLALVEPDDQVIDPTIS